MTRIVHLSDPHFGTVPEGLALRLSACVAALRPDVVVVSGDLTQRAREAQFRAAGRFLSELGGRVLVVPGNHDAPLWNLIGRLFDPWRPWRRFIAQPLDAVVETDGVVVIGLNSANPFVWKDGRVTATQCDWLRSQAARVAGRRCVLALHHPPAPPQGEPPSLAGAEALLDTCAEVGVEMILSGHLHFTHVAPVAAACGVLAVQAGTCLSTRVRTDGNAFTVLDLVAGGVTVTHHRLAVDGQFVADAATVWEKGPDGWR